jgi:iron complex outermembrane receptor protein
MRAGPVGWTVQGRVEGRAAFPLSHRYEPARNEDGGDRNNSDRRLRSLTASVGVDLADGHVLRGSVFAVDVARGVPPSAYAPEASVRWWRLDAWRSIGASVGHSGVWPGGLETDETLWVRSYDNLINAYDDDRYASQDLPRSYASWYRDRLFGGRFRLRWPIGGAEDPIALLSLWSGVEHDRHARDDLSPYTRTLLTLAPQLERRLARDWTLTAGFQLDVEFPGEVPDADLDVATGAGPLLSLRWDPIDTLTLEAVVARRTRFPTLKERFSTASERYEPNPSLGPESAWHFGLEIGWRPLPWLRLAVAGYDAEVEGLIAPVRVSSMTEQFRNLESARLAGLEAVLAIEPLDRLRIEASYRYLHARRLDVGRSTDLLEYRPEHAAGLSVSVEPLPWLGVSTSLRVTGPQRFEHPETRAWGTLGAFLVWDARVDLRPARWIEAWVRAGNLLDADYQTEYGFPEPGLELFAGFRLRCDVFAERCGTEPGDG